MNKRPDVAKIMAVIRELRIAELWEAYLHPCCAGCRTGTADCDVNSLSVVPTEAEAAILLMGFGECP